MAIKISVVGIAFVFVLSVAASPPGPRFVDHGDGTVTDGETELMWTKDTQQIMGRLTWQEAITACNSLNYAGHHDWRLPQVKELQSMIDYGRENLPGLPPGNPFINVQNWYYWSSTPNTSITGSAWSVDMHYGHPWYHDESYDFYVWCVRDGQ